MTTKEALHRLIDRMPEREAERILHDIEGRLHPAVRAILAAPIDDEPLTAEDEAALREGRAAIDAGEVIRDDDLRL